MNGRYNPETLKVQLEPETPGEHQFLFNLIQLLQSGGKIRIKPTGKPSLLTTFKVRDIGEVRGTADYTYDGPISPKEIGGPNGTRD